MSHELLKTDPVAGQLLKFSIPARLSYVWTDGTPRVVPMSFYWTGEVFLMGAPPNAPKDGGHRDGYAGQSGHR